MQELISGTGPFGSDIWLVLISYLIGSIPFGLILTRVTGKGDIRTIGSGNIGATNVLRTGDKTLAALTLMLDASKGIFAVFLAINFSENIALMEKVAGMFAVLGHIFPIWLKFRGGKGVATTLAVLTSLSLPVGLGAILIWVAVFAFTKVSSLSAVLTMTAAPVVAFIFVESTGYGMVYLTLFLSVLVIVKHSSNIRRLVTGQEKPIEFGRKK